MGFLGVGTGRMVGAWLAVIAAIAVPSFPHAQEFCSALAEAADGGASSCRGALLCGIECDDTLCADKRARCAGPETGIVSGRIDIEDVDFSSTRMTNVDGIAQGVAVLPSAIRLYYRRTRPDVEPGDCTEVVHDGLDTDPAICPADSYVVGLKCSSNLCEAFSLRCCAFSVPDPDTAPEPDAETGDDIEEQTEDEGGSETGVPSEAAPGTSD